VERLDHRRIGFVGSPIDAWTQERERIVTVNDIWSKSLDCPLNQPIAANGPWSGDPCREYPEWVGILKFGGADNELVYFMSIFAQHRQFQRYNCIFATTTTKILVVNLKYARRPIHGIHGHNSSSPTSASELTTHPHSGVAERKY
jgi:hypothetical protein